MEKGGESGPAQRYAWMRTAMPGVARLMADKRAELGDAHVTQCLMRGLAGERGWFFAREGPIAVGTPWDDPLLANFAAANVTTGQALVVLRGPGNGA